MIWWALGATAASGLLVYILSRVLRTRNTERESHAREIEKLTKAVEDERRDAARLRHIIGAQQEAMHNAAKEKRDIRDHVDAGDRARAATDKLRGLSGSGDGNSDGAATGD